MHWDGDHRLRWTGQWLGADCAKADELEPSCISAELGKSLAELAHREIGRLNWLVHGWASRSYNDCPACGFIMFVRSDLARAQIKPFSFPSSQQKEFFRVDVADSKWENLKTERDQALSRAYSADQKHFFLPHLKFQSAALESEQLAGMAGAGILASVAPTRRAVLAEHPTCRAIVRQEQPRARSAAILERSTITHGRPRRLPFALALRRPALTRSTINPRSSALTAPRTVKIIWPTGVAVVHLLGEGNEFNAERPKRLERPEQMRHASREPIELPNDDGIKAPAMSVSHQTIELRSAFFRSGDADVDVLAGDLPSARAAAKSGAARGAACRTTGRDRRWRRARKRPPWRLSLTHRERHNFERGLWNFGIR